MKVGANNHRGPTATRIMIARLVVLQIVKASYVIVLCKVESCTNLLEPVVSLLPNSSQTILSALMEAKGRESGPSRPIQLACNHNQTITTAMPHNKRNKRNNLGL
jgi:hypothetical protein